MRKLTAAFALAITLALVAPVATFAAAPQKPRTSSVREDQGPSDPDVISRVFHIISRWFHLATHEQPIIPTP